MGFGNYVSYDPQKNTPHLQETIGKSTQLLNQLSEVSVRPRQHLGTGPVTQVEPQWVRLSLS